MDKALFSRKLPVINLTYAVITKIISAVIAITTIFQIMAPIISPPARSISYFQEKSELLYCDDIDGRIWLTIEGKTAKGNLYLTRLHIWNSGRESIEKEDIRRQPSLSLQSTQNNQARFHRFNLMGTTDTSGFRIINHKDESINELIVNETAVSFDWRLLEKNEGAIIEILYSSKEPLFIDIDCFVKGFKKPTCETRNKAIFDRIIYHKIDFTFSIFLLIVAIGFIFWILSDPVNPSPLSE